MSWKSDYDLAFEPMDSIHHEFIERLDALNAVDPETDPTAWLDALEALILHTREHFWQEDRWMKESQFPPEHCHVGEHENVLGILQEVKRRAIEQEDFETGQRLAKELTPWFEHHAATMDTMLSRHLKAQAYEAIRLPWETLVRWKQGAGTDEIECAC